jgi:hypothetical protein
MKYRKLRIAWSVIWGVAAVLLCVLWVRSYWWSDQYHLQAGRWFGGSTNRGRFVLHWFDVSSRNNWETGYHCYSTILVDWKKEDRAAPPFYCVFLMASGGYSLIGPMFLLAAITAFLAAAPWFRWRFSLRTLLIVTTLVAVVLGVIYAMQRVPPH